HRNSPIGRFFAAFKGDPRLRRVGLIGLGSGALACYADIGDIWTFYEIDPTVIDIARRYFTYLGDSHGHINVTPGDARLVLEREVSGTATPDDHKYGVLVIDAFNSDAIPMHLLTREALEIYRSRLLPDGMLAFHISNRYVDLEPILGNLAGSAT